MFLRALGSQALAVGLLLALAAAAAAGSVPGLERTFSSPPFLLLVLLLALNVSVCSWRRFAAPGAVRWPTPRRGSDLALHAALILVLVGGAIKGAFGSVLTQHVAVGTETATMFDWKSRSEWPLGFTLRVEALDEARFPARAFVGVRDAAGGRKLARLELREGAKAGVPGEAVSLLLEGYEREAGTLRMRVSVGGREQVIIFGTRPGQETEGEAGGYRFSLLAWRSDVRNVRARVSILEGGSVVAAGWLEPNSRLERRGTSLFLTAWGTDDYGTPFCGIQAVRDPGAPAFWAGCVLFALAVPLHLVVKRRGG